VLNMRRDPKKLAESGRGLQSVLLENNKEAQQ
jgi:hypothetical protein